MTAARWTWHGGGLAAARTRFGIGAEPWLDLSTGINPHAWPGAETAPVDWRRLPEEDALRHLEEAAADHFGCDADHVCAVPGTEVGLRLAGDLLTGPARHVAPTYRTHAEMIGGSTPVTADRLETADGSLLILANPNNPDGRLFDCDALFDLLARRGSNGWLIVDEAFADCHPGQSLGFAVNDVRRLLIFRSFGKFFGLAGLRLGFVLGPRPILAELRHRLGAWPVSAAAIAIGTAAYRDTGWIGGMRARLNAEAAELDHVLAGFGYAAQGACPLFRLIESPVAGALFEGLAYSAILIRPFEQQPHWLRIGLPGCPQGLSRLQAALARLSAALPA